MAGAIVVAKWRLERPLFEGSKYAGSLKIIETVTDREGRFRFDGFTAVNVSLGRLEESDPFVLIFHGGHEPKLLSNIYFGNGSSGYPGLYRKAQWDGEIMALQPLTGIRIGTALMYYTDILPAVQELTSVGCEWKETPRFILAMQEEKARLQAQDPEAIVDLLDAGDIESTILCGSPTEFLRDYEEASAA